MPLGIITLEDVLEGKINDPSFVVVMLIYYTIELIGEEIYDEFDKQGRPDLKSFIPHEMELKPPLEQTGSPPPVSSLNVALAQTPSQATKTASAAPHHKPITIPALRSINFSRLGFTRSRSAPPTPRDKVETDVDHTEICDDTPPAVPEGVIFPNVPTVMLPDTNQDSLLMTYSSPQDLPPTLTASETLVVPEVGVLKGNPMHHGLSVTPIRAPVPLLAYPTLHDSSYSGLTQGTSPSPSLEQAILMERKRRATSGAASLPAPKGGRFKSSPLTGERGGMVVAERVKRPIIGEIEGLGKVNDDDRIRNEKDKEGSEKE